MPKCVNPDSYKQLIINHTFHFVVRIELNVRIRLNSVQPLQKYYDIIVGAS